MYIVFEKSKERFLVDHNFGHGLAYYMFDFIKDNKLKPTKVNVSTMTHERDIYEFIDNFIILSSHYIEESLLYKSLIEFIENYALKYMGDDYISREEFEIMSRLQSPKEREQTKRMRNKKFDQAAMSHISHFLKDAKLEKHSLFYSLPFFLEGKQLGFHVQKQFLTLIENGKPVKYTLLELHLTNIVVDGQYFDIAFNYEFMKSSEILQCPNNKNREKSKSKEKYNLSQAYKEIVEDALSLGIITKQ